MSLARAVASKSLVASSNILKTKRLNSANKTISITAAERELKTYFNIIAYILKESLITLKCEDLLSSMYMVGIGTSINSISAFFISRSIFVSYS